jgi:hypothetical protein
LDALWEWPFFEMLSEQWKNTHLLASFIMYLDAIYNYNRVTTFRILHKKVCKLFLRDPFLRALKTMHDNLREVDIQNERIRILNTKLEKAVALKEASKKIFLELDEEWSHKKRNKMEVFPLDIKKMVIKLVSEEKSYNLRHLFCVNKMWRRLVSDYLINNIQKSSFEWFLCCLINISLHRLCDWDVFEILSEQWRGTYLLPSFIMFLDARFDEKPRLLKLSYPKSRNLFLTNPFLIDLRMMDNKLDTISEKRDQIEILNDKLTNAVAEKEAAEKVFQQLDEKWSHKKRKKEKQ